MSEKSYLNMFDYTNRDSLKEFVQTTEKEHEEVSPNGISKVEYLDKEFTAKIYEIGIRSVITFGEESKTLQEYLLNQREAFITYLAAYYDGVKNVRNLKMNGNYKQLMSDSKVRYFGEDTDSFKNGKEYKIIEINNWFHNQHELGYYLTNEDYDGRSWDADYCTFVPMGELGEKFRVEN